MFFKYCLQFIIIVNFLLIINCQSNVNLKEIANSDDHQYFANALDNIMRPRVVGTRGHEQVKNFIIKELNRFGLNVELDSFATNVPIFGNVTFTNIIGRLPPNADKYLTLACHYDSKYFADFNFVAATDSAVPCAMLLNLLQTISPYFEKISKQQIGLMLIFFDGEEAFKEWTDYDSLYGSRHLAQKWQNRVYKNAREINRIDLLMLLDLIGASNQKFYNLYQQTSGQHHVLVEIERLLARGHLLTSNSYMFFNQRIDAAISDDHLPFLHRNIPVLHVIPTQFPKVWHTVNDNAENLNTNTIINFNRILRVFTMHYLFTNGLKN